MAKKSKCNIDYHSFHGIIYLEKTPKRQEYEMEFLMEINRDLYLNKLIRKKNNGFIKIITGIRRCGKSYLLNTLFYNHLLKSGVSSSNIIKFAFDSASDLQKIGENLLDLDLLSGERIVDPNKFLKYILEKTKKNTLFL